MKAKLMGTLALGLILALGMALAAGLMQAQEPPVGDEAAAQEDVSAAVTVDWTISVQGRLTDASGNPINGDRIIRASLYDASTSGTQMCTYSTSVTVRDGYFTTAIYNCNDADFNGQQLYLEIQVGGETLSPREPVRLVPYAATLRPGARIGGSNAGSGALYLYDSFNRRTIALDGSRGFLYLGTNGQDGDIVVYNLSDSETFGVDGDSGNVAQIRTGHGLVKAAVLALCAGSGARVHRSFPTGVTISGGGLPGLCTLVFPFRVDDRYYTATAHGSVTGDLVSCRYTATNTHLYCRRFDNAGNGVNGDIMVVIY